MTNQMHSTCSLKPQRNKKTSIAKRFLLCQGSISRCTVVVSMVGRLQRTLQHLAHAILAGPRLGFILILLPCCILSLTLIFSTQFSFLPIKSSHQFIISSHQFTNNSMYALDIQNFHLQPKTVIDYLSFIISDRYTTKQNEIQRNPIECLTVIYDKL